MDAWMCAHHENFRAIVLSGRLLCLQINVGVLSINVLFYIALVLDEFSACIRPVISASTHLFLLSAKICMPILNGNRKAQEV